MCNIEELKFTKKIRLWLDLGFIGYNPENAEIKRPEKKPKGKELTDEQKKSNRLISRTRVKVEHLLATVKCSELSKKKSELLKMISEI